ncbi:DUF6090 family protein [Mangrovibacterium lignilyticum]|uniref:DUF6090 family protein n=1 Tax=Mangrovibacterium lignilyticum TaxID=2668052 RepID=UPI0013D790D6|nr:DUF6090 family protein [Mangrovibacterium lignilyticum]
MKFFRKIRQSLLSDGKTVRYLKYAIGEITLVVIGILIALSINNWNQNRLVQKEEMGYYKNIKRQLIEDSDIITNNINFNRFYYKQYQYAIELIENDDRSNLDSLAVITINLLEYSDFHQETNAYQALVNSGEIKIINNQAIIDGLQKLEEIYIYINKLETGHFDIIKLIYPELNKIIRLNAVRIENEDLLFSYEFQNYFVITSEIMREKDDIYNRALDEIKAILELIDKELVENG